MGCPIISCSLSSFVLARWVDIPSVLLFAKPQKMPQPITREKNSASVVPTKTDAKNATVVNVKAPASAVKMSTDTNAEQGVVEQGIATASPKATAGQVTMVTVKEAPTSDLKTSTETTTEQGVATASPKATAGQRGTCQ